MVMSTMTPMDVVLSDFALLRLINLSQFSFSLVGCVSYSDTFTRIQNKAIRKYWLDRNRIREIRESVDNCTLLCLELGQRCASFDYYRRCYLNYVTYQQILDGDPSAIRNSNKYDLYTRDCTMD